MARPFKPLNVHILNGTDKKHPDRMRERQSEPVNTDPIGEPSEHLSPIEVKMFNDIVDSCIDGVLGKADRIAVEIAAKLLAKHNGAYTVDGEVYVMTAGEQNLLSKYLGQFGMLPGDRAKISVKPKKDKNPFDD